MKRIKLDFEDAKVTEGVPILHEIPDALEFHSKYFMQQKPLLIRNAIAKWPALKKWTSEYFYQTLGSRLVIAEVRPKNFPKELVKDQDGNTHFCWPLKKLMTIKHFIRNMQNSEEDIYSMKCYLHGNFPELSAHINLDDLNFITESWHAEKITTHFNVQDGRIVQGLHLNQAENAYAVISGYKDFILIPASQQSYVPVQDFAQGVYIECDRKIYMERLLTDGIMTKHTCIAIDPLKPDVKQFPEYKNCTPLNVRVCAGDVLYVPNGYMQHVRQCHGCIMLNTTYEVQCPDDKTVDMDMDSD